MINYMNCTDLIFDINIILYMERQDTFNNNVKGLTRLLVEKLRKYLGCIVLLVSIF